MKWGMVGFEEEEQERPKFKGDLIPSPVDGKLYVYVYVYEYVFVYVFMYFPRSEYMKRIGRYI